MELHRSRTLLIGAIVLGVAGAAVLLLADDPISAFRLAMGGVGVLVAVVLLTREVRPFRFRIDEHGLDLHAYGMSRLVPWPEIDALVLEQPARIHGTASTPSPRLILVPAAGSGLARRRILETDDVKEPADEIARALGYYAGARFTDARGTAPPDSARIRSIRATTNGSVPKSQEPPSQ
jgi:hypothetical protein